MIDGSSCALAISAAVLPRRQSRPPLVQPSTLASAAPKSAASSKDLYGRPAGLLSIRAAEKRPALLGIEDRVAVYFPQSYNVSGYVLVVPRERVRVLEVESSRVMTFLVSGGISGGAQPEAAAARG